MSLIKEAIQLTLRIPKITLCFLIVTWLFCVIYISVPIDNFIVANRNEFILFILSSSIFKLGLPLGFILLYTLMRWSAYKEEYFICWVTINSVILIILFMFNPNKDSYHIYIISMLSISIYNTWIISIHSLSKDQRFLTDVIIGCCYFCIIWNSYVIIFNSLSALSDLTPSQSTIGLIAKLILDLRDKISEVILSYLYITEMYKYKQKFISKKPDAILDKKIIIINYKTRAKTQD